MAYATGEGAKATEEGALYAAGEGALYAAGEGALYAAGEGALYAAGEGAKATEEGVKATGE